MNPDPGPVVPDSLADAVIEEKRSERVTGIVDDERVREREKEREKGRDRDGE